MIKGRIFLINYIISSCLLYSCGGVIGNIEKYRFDNVTLDSLKSAVSRVYLKNPEFKGFDTLKYEEKQSIGDGNYYCKIRINRQEYLFAYAYPQYPSPNDPIVEIALTSAALYGQDLNLARNISVVEKNKLRKIFEKYFIREVRKELRKSVARNVSSA